MAIDAIMLAHSKNHFPVFIDEEHLAGHLDPDQAGGTFSFHDKEEIMAKICSWLGQMTLPPETFRSFPGDPVPPAGPFVVRAVLECPEVIGWHALVDIRDLPDGTAIEWQIRRGYLTKVVLAISPQPCHTVVLMVGRIDRERLQKKIEAEIVPGQSFEEHRRAKLANSPSEWVLLTAYPGMLAPPQNDRVFWDLHAFATGKSSK